MRLETGRIIHLILNIHVLRDNIILTLSVKGAKIWQIILIELRESTGMNRHQFCEYFEIPYMTVSDWEHGKKRVPKYFLRLLEYYVKAEQMNKAKEEQNNG